MNIADEISAVLLAAEIEQKLARRLAIYGELVLEANQRMNLTAARQPASFAEHLLDAMTLAADVKGDLIDVGSGAGLPGIPLALATGYPVVLIDSSKKKAQFLSYAIERLGLNGEALNQRAETLGHDPAYREMFGCATARAVASAPSVAELTIPFLALGGRALLQRGTMDDRERSALFDAAPMLGAEMLEERWLTGERRVLILEKRSPTQQRFPRREGVPQKRPLCF